MINVSASAASKISELLTEEGKSGSGLRVFVQGGGCSGFQYGLMIEESGGVGDQVYESNGVKLFIDPVSITARKVSICRKFISTPYQIGMAASKNVI